MKRREEKSSSEICLLDHSSRTKSRLNCESRVAELVTDDTSKASLCIIMHHQLDMRLQSRRAYAFGRVLWRVNHPEEVHTASLHRAE